MMWARRWLSMTIALLALLVLAPTVAAQEDPLESLSDADFDRVVELLEEAREAEEGLEWQIALDRFETVSAIVELPEVRIREARAHEALGNTSDALAVYERLAALDTEIGDEARGAVARLRPASASEAVPSTSDAPRGGARFALPVTLTTLTVGSFVAGAILGADANAIGDDYLSARQLALSGASETTPNLVALTRLENRRDEAFARARQANVLLGVGSALAVGSTISWVVAARRGASPRDAAQAARSDRLSVRVIGGWSSGGVRLDW